MSDGGLYFYMSAGRITIVCIMYQMSSAVERGAERWSVGEREEEIHLKADADIGERRGVGVLAAPSEGLVEISGCEERRREGIFVSDKSEHKGPPQGCVCGRIWSAG